MIKTFQRLWNLTIKRVGGGTTFNEYKPIMNKRMAPAGSSCRIGVIRAHARIMTKAGEGPEAEQGQKGIP